MNLALGLFHFNPHWGANERSANRHCTETLGPFLHALHSNPRWRVDIEISGSGLEFLQSGYPEQIRLLRELVHRGQVELISALYTPNIWIAFPRRDLEMSIELNRRCLEKLGFPWSRIFFAQEAFFGEVVQALTDSRFVRTTISLTLIELTCGIHVSGWAICASLSHPGTF